VRLVCSIKLALHSLLAAGAMAACTGAIPASPGATDPCTQLGQLCPSCAKATDQEQCQQALTASDPTQCTILLSSTSFLADCTPRDAGPDADGSAHDAAPLPACGSQASADAGCACTGNCSPACPGGGCTFTCASGTCTPTCAGGGCLLQCLSGATCEGSCSGGNCRVVCQGGSQCANTCSGGGCNFQCDVNAVCNDTCGSATTCVGM
jgi:hypothetical protein